MTGRHEPICLSPATVAGYYKARMCAGSQGPNVCRQYLPKSFSCSLNRVWPSLPMIFFPSCFPIPKILGAYKHFFSLTDRCPTTNGTTSTSHSRSAENEKFILLFITQPSGTSGLLSQRDFSASVSFAMGEAALADLFFLPPTFGPFRDKFPVLVHPSTVMWVRPFVLFMVLFFF